MATKTYQLKINGITESIDGINSLLGLLKSVEERIKTLETAKVNISSPSSSGGADKVRTSALSEEDKLEKSILQTEEKIKATQSERYQQLLAEKDLLKEAVKDQKELAAQERLTANVYNLQTMEGMKEKLADIKKVMQTTDIGDNDAFKKLTQEANELNSKLLEIEKSYGQFGRQVGNYPAAAEGFKQLEVNVGGVTQQFDNARQAMKALKTEMQTLSTKKDMGLISEAEAKRLENLIPTVKRLESSIQDAGKPMDSIMDTMESITALVSAGKGVAAFFGFDDDKIQKSIQQLVALQNAMKSLQTIQKQLQSGEGFGKYFNMGGEAIDGFVNKLFGVKKASDEAATAENVQASATKGVATSSNAATTATNTQTVATKNLTTAQKAATVAAKALSTALKGIGIGLVIYGITQLVDGIGSWIKSLNELSAAEKAAEKATEASEEAYAKTKAELNIYKAKIDAFNGSKKEEKELIDELNKKYAEQMGTYQSLVEWKEALINKSKDYIKQLTEEAEFSVYQEEYTKALKAQAQIQRVVDELKNEGKENTLQYKLATDALNDATSTTNKLLDELEKKLQSLNHTQSVFGRNLRNWVHDFADELRNLGENLSGKTSGGTSGVDSRIKAEEVIQQLTLKLMKDGLNKRLRQLDEEKRQTLAKVKGTAQQKLDIEKKYDELRLKEIQDYLDSVKSKLESSANSIASVKFNIDTSEIQSALEKVNFEIGKLEGEVPQIKNLLSSSVYEKLLNDRGVTKETLYSASQLVSMNMEVEDLFPNVNEKFKKELEEAVKIVKEYGYYINNVLGDAFAIRFETQSAFYHEQYNLLEGYIQDRKDLLKEEADNELKQSKEAALAEWKNRDKELKASREQLEENLALISSSTTSMTSEQEAAYNEMEKTLNEVLQQMLDNNENYARQVEVIKSNHEQRYAAIDKEEKDNLKRYNSEYFETQLSNLRDFNSKLNQEMSKQPVYDQLGFGIINIEATKKNYKEMEAAVNRSLQAISYEKDNLSQKFKDKLINEKDYNAILNQLNDLERAAKDNLQEIGANLGNLVGEWWNTVNNYVQTLGNALQTIIEANNTYQDYLLDKQQEALEKQNERLQEKLKEQEDILSKHKDKVNDIESELSTARGDRREELIDQLNEEIRAQREAAAEKARLDKEEEALKKRQEKLEKERKKVEYERNLQSILLNGAMTVSNALTTTPFVPTGIAMAALAASLTAYQYTKAKAAKPYKEGGVIDAPSHKEGGVKVFGGSVELEGLEYIVNKKTTTQNVQLLDYINSKKKKIDLGDMIEFFNDKPRKVLKSINGKFETGGLLPSSIDIKEQLRDVVLVQSQQPIYVAVTDIEKKMEDVRYIRTIAGASNRT